MTNISTYTTSLSVFIGVYSAPACGEWVTVGADTDPSELHEIGARIAAQYGCEEYGIFDTDCEYGVSSLIGEGGYAVACNLAAALDEVEGGTEFAFVAWIENTTPDVAAMSGSELVEAFGEDYCGAFDELSDYAAQIVEECYDLSPMGSLALYFDYAAFGRDLELGGDIWTARVDGTLHVFRNS